MKFRIHPKIFEGRVANLGKCWENVKIIGFFDISCDILNKMKDKLDKKCVKKGFYLSRAKLEQLPLISLEK